MNITVLFFGVLTDVSKCSSITLKANSIGELKNILSKKYPKLNDFKFNIAVNQQIIKSEIQLNENDEVALLPPYSGG